MGRGGSLLVLGLALAACAASPDPPPQPGPLGPQPLRAHRRHAAPPAAEKAGPSVADELNAIQQQLRRARDRLHEK